MEKLGVVMDEEKVKTASKKFLSKCPKCGGDTHHDPEMNVPWCPKCGTEPFEKRAEE